MFYIIGLIGIVAILIFILCIRKSKGASNYHEGSKVWQNELDQRMADDYRKQSGVSSPYNDEFWDPYD